VARASKSPAAILSGKKDKLRWGDFNFLENLLVFCAYPSRAVPKESKVHFQISPAIKDEAVCVLFKIDRERDPIMPGGGPKPDYMALYVSKDRCICTIIELKGTDQKKLKHGIEQIKALRDRLRDEIAEHLPGKCRAAVKFQGLLLTPPNSDIPRELIEREKEGGFTILTLQWPHQFQLYDYVRKQNLITERYVPRKESHRGGSEFNVVEELFTKCVLPERIDDAFRAERLANAHRKKAGVYVNFADKYQGAKEYAAMSACSTDAVVAFSSAGFMKEIEDELARLGLPLSLLKRRVL
jgi:hypothetical protein